MIDNQSIKIQNIYYMLAYAFSVLKNDAYKKFESEEFENAADLLSEILSKGISLLVKKGLGKDYISVTEPLYTMRGKIDIPESIKKQTMLKKQLICSYDELSINTRLNQIIKTTLNILLKSDIKLDIKKELKKLMLYFKEVDVLNPYIIDWNIRFNSNNASYQMLINICYLVINGLLQKEDNGDMKLQKFLDEQRMCKLYEKFILEYYKKHYPHLKVSSSQIDWNIENDDKCIAFLPKMQSDIMISNGKQILIIDAKYYSKSMSNSQFGNKKTFHSHNLYQIFTYVKNKDKNNNGNVSGVLLYAKTDEEVRPNAKFIMGGNLIVIQSLDLNVKFRDLQESLNKILLSW